MIHCDRCGKELEDEARFCSNCGTKLKRNEGVAKRFIVTEQVTCAACEEPIEPQTGAQSPLERINAVQCACGRIYHEGCASAYKVCVDIGCGRPIELATNPYIKLRKIKRCLVCRGDIKPEDPLAQCMNGHTFHEPCAARIGHCPICSESLQQIQSRLEYLHTEGYKTPGLEELLIIFQSDIEGISREIDQFERKITRLREIENSLTSLDTTGAEEYVYQIQRHLHDPTMLDEIEQWYKVLIGSMVEERETKAVDRIGQGLINGHGKLLQAAKKGAGAAGAEQDETERMIEEHPLPSQARAMTFDTFIQDANNRQGFTAAQQVASDPGSINPLFLYGGSGLGKTHLMFATANELKDTRPRFNVMYLGTGPFKYDYEVAKDEGAASVRKLVQQYSRANMLLMDDIQFVGDDDEVQAAVFQIFENLQLRGDQIIMTSDCPPAQIEALHSRLRTRFAAGLTTELKPPNLKTKHMILKREYEREREKTPSLEIADNVLLLIANQAESVREIKGILNTVILRHRTFDCEVTDVLAEAVIKEVMGEVTRGIIRKGDKRKRLEAVRSMDMDRVIEQLEEGVEVEVEKKEPADELFKGLDGVDYELRGEDVEGGAVGEDEIDLDLGFDDSDFETEEELMFVIETVSCPRCGNDIAVEYSEAAHIPIACQRCGVKGEVSNPNAKHSDDEDYRNITSMSCPKCKKPLPVPKSKASRVYVECSHCGAKGTLKNPNFIG